MSSLDERGAREEHRFTVPRAAAGARLDQYLASALGTSRRSVSAGIEKGWVTVDGRHVPKGELVAAGQIVVARLPRPDQGPVPEPERPLVIRLQDPDLLVVEKPAGWPTHPLEPGELGTAANAWMARFPECATAGRDPREGGVAHRLDTPTSGLLLVARNRGAWEKLRAQFSLRQVGKEYLAWVEGAPETPVRIEGWLERTPGSPGKMRVAAGATGQEALTLVRTERRFAGSTLLRCTIETGVMHQIRVHLASIGHAIGGDPLYGGPLPRGLGRLFLHATRLRFTHPRSGAEITVDSPLPPDLQAFLDNLPERT